MFRNLAAAAASITDLDKGVLANVKACREHAQTEGFPAPVERPIMTEIASAGGYEVEVDPEPAPVPLAAPPNPDTFAALGRLVEVLTRTGVLDAREVAHVLGLSFPEEEVEEAAEVSPAGAAQVPPAEFPSVNVEDDKGE